MKKLIMMLVATIILLTAVGCTMDRTNNSAENTGARMVQSSQSTAPSLSKENAEKIALEYVGFTADQVRHLDTHYEIDDRVPQYDVEFYEGEWEYEFEIHAESGEIISFDKDRKTD